MVENQSNNMLNGPFLSEQLTTGKNLVVAMFR